MMAWMWIALAVSVLIGALVGRIVWVLRKRRRKAPRNDIYPLW